MSVFTHLLRVLTGDSNQNLRQTQEHAERTEKSLRDLESRAGRVGSASTKLAGALGRVSPVLGEQAMLINDVADGLEVAALAGPKLIAVLGPLAVAATVAAGAYLVLKGNLDQANAAMEEAAKKSEEMVKIHDRVREAANLAALAEGRLSQEEFNRLSAAKDAEDVYKAQIESQRERIKGLEDERFELEQAIAAEEKRQEAAMLRVVSGEETAGEGGIRAGTTPMSALAASSNELERLTVELQKNATSIERQQTALSVLQAGQQGLADDLEIVANATNNVTTATQEMTEAMVEAVEVVREFDPSAITGTTPDLGRLIPAVQTSDILARDQAVTDAMIQASRQQTLGQVAGAVRLAGMPMQGLGMLGPAGAIVGGLAQIGAAGGASGVEKQLDTLIDNVTDGIIALPEILIEVIPEFVFALVTELPPALARAIEDVFIRLLNLIPGVNIRTGGVGPDALSAAAASEQEGRLQALQEAGVVSEAGVIFGLGTAGTSAGSRSREAASRGRMARADGARRLAMSRAPTAQIMGSPSLTINALGIDDGTQDQFQRRFARYTDPNTGLRGRDG